MPQDLPDALEPTAPFAGSFGLPERGMTQRWLDGRDLAPELSTELLEVIRRSFNDDVSWFRLPVSPADHFAWKFRDRPTGVTLSISFDEDGHPFGFAGNVRRVWTLRGRPYVARSGYDICRLPEWQGRGLHRLLTEFQGRDWHPSEDFSFGYSTHPATRKLSIERGDRAPANETHDYIRHLGVRPIERTRALLDGLRGAFGSRRAEVDPTVNAGVSLSQTTQVIRADEDSRGSRLRDAASRAALFARAQLARRPATPTGNLTLKTIDRFEEAYQPFIQRALAPFEFAGERSTAYLNWRFCDERGGPFTVRLATRDGEAVGYAVTRVLDDGSQLADILVVPGQRPAAEVLVRDAIDLARAGGAPFITTRLPRHHPYTGALRRTAFVDVGAVAGELISLRRTGEADVAFLARPNARIHHVLADSDDV